MVKWITFEGGEGVGKSTQIKHLHEWFSSENISHVTTREPGGTPAAEAVRNLFLTFDDWSAFSESCLMSTARDHHFHNYIKPSLERGDVVMCDRFFDSTLAYQHFGHGIDRNFLESLYIKSIGNQQPDITFLLDMDIETSQNRCQNRFYNGEKAADRFDQKNKAFFNKIRQGFLTLAHENPQRIHTIDASLKPEVIAEKIKNIIISKRASS